MGLAIGLHWPWGSVALGTSEGDLKEDLKEDEEDGDMEVAVRGNASPAKLTPSIVNEPERESTSPNSSSSSSPSSSRGSSPQRRRVPLPSRSEPVPTVQRDTLYDALVKQWCFAQGPAPPEGGGGVSPRGARRAVYREREGMATPLLGAGAGC
jgi:hypothetical protein